MKGESGSSIEGMQCNAMGWDGMGWSGMEVTGDWMDVNRAYLPYSVE